MTASDYCDNLIPALSPADSGLDALRWMNEYQIKHLPIALNGIYLGIISEDDILDLDDPNKKIGSFVKKSFRPFVEDKEHLINIFNRIKNVNLSIIPVLDKKEKYLGLIRTEELLHILINNSNLGAEGGILTLILNYKDYSLAEISRIVESNNAKITTLLTRHIPESPEIELTLKIDKTDLWDIIATFERFEYDIASFFHESRDADYLKERYDLLMKYLSI